MEYEIWKPYSWFLLPRKQCFFCSISFVHGAGGALFYFNRAKMFFLSWGLGMGLPYISSNAPLTFNISLGGNLMWNRAIGSNLIQFSWVSWCIWAKVHFKVWWMVQKAWSRSGQEFTHLNVIFKLQAHPICHGFSFLKEKIFQLFRT